MLNIYQRHFGRHPDSVPDLVIAITKMGSSQSEQEFFGMVPLQKIHKLPLLFLPAMIKYVQKY